MVGSVAERAAALVVGIGAGVQAGIDDDRQPDVLAELLGEHAVITPRSRDSMNVLGELVGHREQGGVVDDRIESAEPDEGQVLLGSDPPSNSRAALSNTSPQARHPVGALPSAIVMGGDFLNSVTPLCCHGFHPLVRSWPIGRLIERVRITVGDSQIAPG
jgi:hypothetical protein